MTWKYHAGIGQYWSELLATPTEGAAYAWDELSTPEQTNRTMNINYSRGTTGRPKGVEITHKNQVANLLQYTGLAYPPERKPPPGPENWLCYPPFYHALGQQLFIGIALYRNVCVYIMARYDLVQLLRNVERFRITRLVTLPPVAVQMAKSPETKKYDLSSVRAVVSGAAPAGADILEQARALWPEGTLHVSQAYGMTEYVFPCLIAPCSHLRALCRAF